MNDESALLRLAAENRKRIAELEGRLAGVREENKRLSKQLRDKENPNVWGSRGHAVYELGKCEEQRDRQARLLLEIEGALLGYWTSIPQHVIQGWLPRLRAILDAPQEESG